MNTLTPANPHKNHRFPAEIIGHAVWLYFRFCLSSRDVEELLLARGVIVTYEAIRKWCRKFGQAYGISFGIDGPSPATSGTWMKSFSQSIVNGTTCGGQWTRMGMSSIFWCSVGGTRTRPRNSSSSCSRAAGMFSGDHHGQAQELRCRKAGDAAWGGAPPPPLSEQSR
jgi:hypothetical protein